MSDSLPRVPSVGKRGPIVLHVAQSLRGGGAEAFVRELIPRIRRRGIDARVLCAYGTSQLMEAEAPSWAGTIYYQERNGISRFHYLQRMRRLMRQISPALVHTHTHVGASWGRAAAVLAGVPHIAHTEHRSIETLSTFERVAFSVLNRHTDTFITFSERTAELMRRRESIRDVRIIPNGIRVRPMPTKGDRKAARQELGFGEDVVIVGAIANLQPHKNPSLLIDSIARLSGEIRGGIRLVLFGDGPLRADLQRRSKELGIEPLVRFCGFRTDLQQLLPGLDMVLTTSTREMMPISLLEAMNAALPIIGVPHVGTLDLVVDGETGIILKSWDPADLAEAIDWSATHPQWRAHAGNAAYLRLKNYFDIETVADRYANLYQDLLGHKLVLS